MSDSSIRPTQKVQLPFHKSYAFVVGINAYEHITKLKTARQDALDLSKLFTEVHLYDEVHTLIDEQATVKGMRDFLKQMGEKVSQKDDRVVFYFAGHGIARDSADDPKGYLVPADFDPDRQQETLFDMQELQQALHALPCRHGLLILDCCFAGSFKWSTGFRSSLIDDSDEILYAERFLRFVESPAWQVIVSSAHDQKALDVIRNRSTGMRLPPEVAAQNSPFAAALKEALDMEGKADVQRNNRSDGVITATELYLYLRDRVETLSMDVVGRRQSPALFPLQKHDIKGEFIFINPRHPLTLQNEPATNPYQGLKPFQQEHTSLMFGRKQEIREMVGKLQQTDLLVVSGPSGQGKSSALHAGLIPYLEKVGYTAKVLSPRDKREGVSTFLQELDPKEKELFVLDPFGEILSMEEELRQTILTSLTQLWNRIQQTPPESRKLKWVMAVRSDFEWKLRHSELGKAFWKDESVRDFVYRMPPMSLENMRKAIVKPAWIMAYEFDSEALIDQILEEINNAPGALPLLSITLQGLFAKRNRSKRLITQESYKEMGGVNGALSRYAEQVYQELGDRDKGFGPIHKAFVRILFLRMVTLTEGSYSRRRIHRKPEGMESEGNPYGPVYLDELDFSSPFQEVREEVLAHLESASLIRIGKEGNLPFVEPIHDALLNHWPTCLAWIEELGHETLLLQRQLWQAVGEYHNPSLEEGYGESREQIKLASLWANNPKLQQLQIALTDPRDEWLCKQGWADKSISSVSFLVWEQQPTEAELHELRAWNWHPAFGMEDDQKRFEAIRAQMDLWVNHAELDFVKLSFERQQSELERLTRQRDEAIRAKEAAEAARERTVTEMIEASWKFGTLIEPAEIVQGAREFYKQLKLLVDLKKVRSLSPVPVFISGPHGEDYDLFSNHFGHYNPEFLDWAKEYVIPASKNAVLRTLTQPFFNAFILQIARAYFLSYQYLKREATYRVYVQKEYVQYLDNIQKGKEPNHGLDDSPETVNRIYGRQFAQYQYEGGGLFLEERFKTFGEAYDKAFNKTEYYIGYYYSTTACGFWIRRHIDGTAAAFFEILELLLETYDKEWKASPPALPI